MITLASIAFAVFFAVLMRSMQLGTYERLIETMVKSTTGYVRLQSPLYQAEPSIENSFSLDNESSNQILALDGVSNLYPRIDGFSLAANKDQTKGVMVQGFMPSLEVESLDLERKLVSGEIFNDNDEAVLIAEGVSKYFGVGAGDTIVMLGQGYHGVTAAGKYPIKGVLKYPNPTMNNSLILLPLHEAQTYFSASDLYTGMVVDMENEREHVEIQAQIESIVDTSQVVPLTWEEILPEIVQTIEADSAGGIIMIFILYMVISFGILGTVIMMTNDRLYEFGVLLSIGFKRVQLITVVFLEVLMLGLLGVILGAIIAYPIMSYFHYNPIQLGGDMAKYLEQVGWEAVLMFSIEPSILWSHGFLILCVAVVISIYPTLKIKWLKPIDAMRS